MSTPNDQSPARPMGIGRILVSTLVLVALGAAGYAAYFGVPSSASPAATASVSEETDPDASPARVEAPAALPVPVLTAHAERADLVMKITATGNAEAMRKLEIQAATTGEIGTLNVVEGQIIQAGDLVAALDDAELVLNVEKARESYIAALARFVQNKEFLAEGLNPAGTTASGDQAEFERLLSADKFRDVIDDPRFDAFFATITRDEVMAAQDQLLTQSANYRQAELNLSRARITAPFGGQIAELEVVEGQRVAPGTKLFTLVDASPIRVRVEVLESEAGLVVEGRRAEVEFAAYPGRTFLGNIESVGAMVDPEERTLEVLVTLPNPELRLKPGMFAQIILDTEIFPDRLVVPADAVLLREDRPMLFVVQNGRSQWVYIQKGLENADWVEVLDGVQAGDEVIVSGHYSMAHDTAVRVVEPETADQGS